MRGHWILRLLVGGTLLAIVLFQIEWRDVFAATHPINGHLITGAFLVFGTQALFEGWRFKRLYQPYGLSSLQAVKLFFTSLFFSNFLPGSLGADLFQVQHLNRLTPGVTRPITYVVLLRLSGLVINLSLAILTGILLFQNTQSAFEFTMDTERLVRLFLLAGSVVFIGLIIGYILLRRTMDPKQARHWFHERQREVFDAISALTFPQILVIVVAGILIVGARAVALAIVTQAFGQEVPWTGALLVVSVTTLVAMVPISIGGLGVREASMATMLSLFGLSLSDASAIAVVILLFVWTLSATGGILWIRSRTPTEPR